MQLRDFQQDGITKCRQAFAEGAKRILFSMATGGGKCLGRNTPVLMFDGTIRLVQNIRAGQLLMGPDSKPRRVVSTCRGREKLYRVTPKKYGEPFVCNESHILSLRITPGCNLKTAGQVVNISVADYLKKTNNFKHCAKLWRTGVEFQGNRRHFLSPYFLGAWLGDGSSDTAEITTGDGELIMAVREEAARYSLFVNIEPNSENSIVARITSYKRGKGTKNEVLAALQRLKLINNKHIPHQYKTADRQSRLELLAGLIDTDGYMHHNFFEITQKNVTLANDIAFVARSLGFAVYTRECCKSSQRGTVGTYVRISICGNVSEIPVRIARKKAEPRQQVKSVLVTGFTLEDLGEGDYYGFEIEGTDRLFLLGDFTVTHNTALMAYAADGVSKKGNQSAIIAHRQELILQTSLTLAKQGIYHTVIAPDSVIREAVKSQVAEFGRSFFNTAAPVSCSSVQTLGRRNLADHPFKFLFWDECHHVVPGNMWGKIFQSYPDAWSMGVTATPERLDGKGLGTVAGGFFQTMIEGPQAHELMELGWLTYADIWGTPHQYDFSDIDTETRSGKELMAGIVDKPSITGCAIDHYSRICPGQPAIAFCINIEHAKNVAEQFRAAGYKFQCIDGTMKDSERRAVIKALGDGRLHGLTSCEIVNEGTDIPVVTAAILLRPTKSLGLHLQQIGRVLRPVYPRGADLSTVESRLFAIQNSVKPRAIILDHVGNCNLHGFPDDIREWSLEGRSKRKSSSNSSEPTVKARTCIGTAERPGCFAIYSSRLSQCPACGVPAQLTQREIEFKEGQLVRLQREEEERKKRAQYWSDRQAQADAADIESLIKHFMSKGMELPKARARARHIMQARENKRGATTPDLITN